IIHHLQCLVEEGVVFKMIVLPNQYQKILMKFLKWSKTTWMMKFHF
ncbi:uncharacterized protein METZ01_LOCUS376821, partial [marine metagenome]